jgi:hypothetical protein
VTVEQDIRSLRSELLEARTEIDRLKQRFPKNARTTAEDGHVHLAGPPACRVYNSANINVADSDATVKLTFDSERFDTDSMHSTSSNTGRIIFNTKGRYWVWGSVNWATANAGRRVLTIKLNGTTSIASDTFAPNTANPYDQQVAGIYDFAKGDYIELFTYQDSGTDPLVINNAGNYSPEFAAFRLGASGGTAGPAAGADHGSLTGLTDVGDHPSYLLVNGSRALSGNLSVNPNVTIDGVDLSAHVADADAHHTEAGGGVTNHQLLTNRDHLLAHTQYPLRSADMIITGAWQWGNHQVYKELAAPSNPSQNFLKLYAREKPTDATKIEFVFVTSQGDVVVLGEGNDTAPAAHTNILTLNWVE